MKETRRIDALTMANTQLEYVVTMDDGQEIEFPGTAFMLWCGLHEFLNTFYKGWVKVECVTGIFKNTIYNR